MLATPRETIPALARIIRAPILAPSGRIVSKGYDDETRTFYAPHGFDHPPVSENPSKEEVAAAVALFLEELLGDFPFADQADRANVLAMFLLPFVREVIGDEPTPLHLIEKPSPGSGGSMLVETLGMVASGSAPAFMTEGRDEDEWRKRLTSTLLAGEEVIVIDNLRRRLDSAALSSVLTARIWTDRILGKSENANLPVRSLWVATGNNPAVSSEIARRCVPIRIDPKMDRPADRPADGFRHPRLLEWTRNNRGQLVQAALTLARAWIAADRPRGSASLGSYESRT